VVFGYAAFFGYADERIIPFFQDVFVFFAQIPYYLHKARLNSFKNCTTLRRPWFFVQEYAFSVGTG